jgi:TldD protein
MDFDDEIVRSKPVRLIQEGVFGEPLLSLSGAYALGLRPNGRGRARDFRFEPKPRMANIRLCSGETSLEEMFSRVKDGYYLIGSLGAITSGRYFHIQCQYGYRIQGGKLTEPVLKPMISGLAAQAIRNILAVGNDSQWVEDGGCLSGDQFLELSGRGAPHLLLGHTSVV